MVKAKEAENDKNFDEALVWIDKALEIEQNVKTIQWKSGTLFNLSRYDEALVWCDKGLEIDQNYVYFIQLKGRILCELGNYDEALVWIDKALELELNNENVAWKARVLTDLKKHDEIIVWLDKLLEFEPNNILAIAFKVDSLISLKKYDEALVWLDKLLEFEPNNILAIAFKVDSLISLKKYDEALVWCDNGLGIEPTNQGLLKQKEELLQFSQGIGNNTCYWCKQVFESDGFRSKFCSKNEWILENHAQCINCNQKIQSLTSKELENLKLVESVLTQKYDILVKLEREAFNAEFKANWQKYSDMFNGVANAGIAGGILPNSDTQFLKNSATQTKASVQMQMIDIKTQMESTKNQIKHEKVVLAKKYFFGENITPNEPTNDGSRTEDNEAVKILKVRYAKGEITREEFEKMKKDVS